MYISHIGNKISYKKTKKNMYKLFKSNNPLYMNLCQFTRDDTI